MYAVIFRARIRPRLCENVASADLQQIQQWKNDSEHLLAQTLGKTKWYDSYTVQVAEICREYHHKVTD